MYVSLPVSDEIVQLIFWLALVLVGKFYNDAMP